MIMWQGRQLAQSTDRVSYLDTRRLSHAGFANLVGVIHILDPSVRRLDRIDRFPDEERKHRRACTVFTGTVPRSGTG